jgi:hypothetical protein
MAALSGATGLSVYPPGIPDFTVAGTRVTDIVTSNNAQMGAQMQVVVNPISDITYYGPNSTFTGILNTGVGKNFQTLGPRAYIIKVTSHLWVPFYFASALGLPGVTVSRTAYVYTGPVKTTTIAPIWMWYSDGIYTPGNAYNVYEGKEGSEIHSFGLAAFAGGSTPSIAHFIQGNNLSLAEQQAATYSIGDTLPVTNGNHGGAWKSGFNDSPDGRLYRATLPPYDTQTPTNYTVDNPRILIVPLLHGDPTTGGSSIIDSFGAFWITSADFAGSNTQITGQFLNYETVPSGVPDPRGVERISIIKLIQ